MQVPEATKNESDRIGKKGESFVPPPLSPAACRLPPFLKCSHLSLSGERKQMSEAFHSISRYLDDLTGISGALGVSSRSLAHALPFD